MKREKVILLGVFCVLILLFENRFDFFFWDGFDFNHSIFPSWHFSVFSYRPFGLIAIAAIVVYYYSKNKKAKSVE